MLTLFFLEIEVFFKKDYSETGLMRTLHYGLRLVLIKLCEDENFLTLQIKGEDRFYTGIVPDCDISTN